MTFRRYDVVGLMFVLVITSCTTPPVQRVALLAPFEGQHREIGYQALYAARMAIAEADRTHLELLAIDDGGSLTTAQDRARALNNDPLVTAVLLLGPHPTDDTTLALFDDRLERIIIGQWEKDSEALGETDSPTTCGDLCQLRVFTTTSDNLDNIIVETAAAPVTDDFAARYAAFDSFAPAPLPIAYLTYQMTSAWLRGETPPVEVYTYRYTADGQLAPLTAD